MVQLYTQPDCEWCVRAKILLKQLNYSYDEINEKHPNHATVPYIIIDNEPIGGFLDLASWARRTVKP